MRRNPTPPLPARPTNPPLPPSRRRASDEESTMLRMQSFAIFLGLASLVAPPARAASEPNAVVQGIADDLAKALDGRKEEMKNNRDALIKLIDGIVLPHFDIDYASILVLGQNAKSTSPEQRARCAKAFYNSISHRYAEGLLNYTRGRVNVLPFKGELNDKRSLVRTEVVLDDGKKVPVDYAFQDQGRRLEGLRRDHRRHFLRHQLPQPGGRGNPEDQRRCAHHAPGNPG